MRSFRHINFEILKFFYTRRKCTLRARLENGEISGEKRHGHAITKYSGRTQYSRTQRAAICPNARVTNQAAAGNSGTCAKRFLRGPAALWPGIGMDSTPRRNRVPQL